MRPSRPCTVTVAPYLKSWNCAFWRRSLGTRLILP
ncbi:Uncharacterised protein [Bordetella pertussis]|nr:Uncharacterised protein [Bordetella pertussis]